MNLDSAVFYSKDILKVIPFYRDLLGFKLEYQSERFVSFIFPNGGRLGIKNQTEEREIPGYQTVFIWVDDIAPVYNDLKNKKAQFYKELQDYSWGKEFSILDTDGNKVLYMERPKTKKLYKKLIRDRIPEKIISNGGTPITRVLNDEEFLSELVAKIHEETEEIEEVMMDRAKIVEELADLQEIIDTILKYHNITNEDLNAAKNAKREKRGGFEKRLYLENVENDK